MKTAMPSNLHGKSLLPLVNECPVKSLVQVYDDLEGLALRHGMRFFRDTRSVESIGINVWQDNQYRGAFDLYFDPNKRMLVLDYEQSPLLGETIVPFIYQLYR